MATLCICELYYHPYILPDSYLLVRRAGPLYVGSFHLTWDWFDHSPATIPIAIFSERSSSRRMPFVLGLAALLASQILFMEAPNFALMAIARVLQGISSSVAWVIGLALL